MNNLEKFYDKKGLYEIFENDKKGSYEHFTRIKAFNNNVEMKMHERVSSKLTSEQERYIMNIIEQYINEKQKDIEEKIMGELALGESNAANQVINDLKLRDIVWIKQEVN